MYWKKKFLYQKKVILNTSVSENTRSSKTQMILMRIMVEAGKVDSVNKWISRIIRGPGGDASNKWQSLRLNVKPKPK